MSSGFGGVVAGAAGLLRGATFGLSDMGIKKAVGALGAEGDEELAGNVLSGLREQHAGLSGATELAGALAPTLLTGGAAAAAEGGVAAGGAGARGLALASRVPTGAVLPSGFASALGGAAERGVTGLLGEGSSVIGTGLRKAAAMGAQGAVEGGLYGMGNAVTEAALGNHDLTAESLMSHGISDALFGGAVGGGLGLLTGSGAKAFEALQNRRTGALEKAVESGENKGGLANFIAKASAAASGADIDAIERLGVQNLSKEAQEARRIAVFDAPKIREEVSRSVRSNLDELMEASNDLSDEARGALKKGYVQKAVQTGNEVETATASLSALGGARQKFQELSALATESGLGKNDSLLRRLKTADRWFAKTETAVDTASNAERFMAMDQAKRELGRWTKAIEDTFRKTDDSFRLEVGQKVNTEFKSLYEGLKTHLEDTSLWGKAAEDQKAINGAWSKKIDAQNIFDQRLTNDLGPRDPSDPWRKIRKVDATKADNYVAGLTDAKNDQVHSAIKSYVEGSKELSEAIGQAYQLPPDKLAQLNRVRTASEAFGKDITKAEETLTLANQFAAIRKSEGESALAKLGTIGSIAGSFLGPLGAVGGGALGMLAEGVTRPGKAIAQLAALERIKAQALDRMDKSALSFLRKKPTVLAEGARTTARAESKATMNKAKDIIALVGQPGLMKERIGKAVESVKAVAPSVANRIAMKAESAYQFLNSKIPKPTEAYNALQPQFDPKHGPSDAEVTKVARYMTAIQDPQRFQKELQAGKLTKETVEATKAVYPETFAFFRDRLLEHATNMKTPMSYQQKLMLSTLLEAPLDNTLKPGFWLAMQQAYQKDAAGAQGTSGGATPAPGAAPTGGPHRPLKLPTSLTTSQQLESRGRAR